MKGLDKHKNWLVWILRNLLYLRLKAENLVMQFQGAIKRVDRTNVSNGDRGRTRSSGEAQHRNTSASVLDRHQKDRVGFQVLVRQREDISGTSSGISSQGRDDTAASDSRDGLVDVGILRDIIARAEQVSRSKLEVRRLRANITLNL